MWDGWMLTAITQNRQPSRCGDASRPLNDCANTEPIHLRLLRTAVTDQDALAPTGLTFALACPDPTAMPRSSIHNHDLVKPRRVPRRPPLLPASMRGVSGLRRGAGHCDRAAAETSVEQINGAHQP